MVDHGQRHPETLAHCAHFGHLRKSTHRKFHVICHGDQYQNSIHLKPEALAPEDMCFSLVLEIPRTPGRVRARRRVADSPPAVLSSRHFRSTPPYLSRQRFRAEDRLPEAHRQPCRLGNCMAALKSPSSLLLLPSGCCCGRRCPGSSSSWICRYGGHAWGMIYYSYSCFSVVASAV